MDSITSHPLFWLLLIAGLATLAVLPTLIALARGANDLMLIVLVNVLGCALVLGWPVALVMALRWPCRSDVWGEPSGTSHRHSVRSMPR